MPRFFLRNRDRLGFYAEIEIIFGAVRLNILHDFAEIFDLYSYPKIPTLKSIIFQLEVKLVSTMFW